MYPHFLCIGAQKAGTTWLYDNLQGHPEVWLAPVKEIFYFDKPTRLPLALQLCGTGPEGRSLRQHTFGGVSKRLKGRRAAEAPPPQPEAAPAAPAMPAAPGDSKAKRIAWHLRFMFMPRTDGWYASLFKPGPGQMAGDINPYLAAQEDAVIARIHRLMPKAKIVYLIRNPVDRMWSQVQMSMREYGAKSLDELNPDILRRALEIASTERLSDYAGNVRRWREHYGEEGIFVGFFDQLVEDPRALLTDIMVFLGLSHDEEHIPPSVKKKSNPGSGPVIPAEYSQLLADLFLPKLADMHALFDNAYTARWLADVRQRVESGA